MILSEKTEEMLYRNCNIKDLKSNTDEEDMMDTNKLVFSIKPDFMESISKILEDARRNAKIAINLSMVYAYFEIGRKIIRILVRCRCMSTTMIAK